jgi:hypothetical protein
VPKVLRFHLIFSGGRVRSCQEGTRNSQRNLEPWRFFKLSKVAGELHRFLQGVQKAFENNLSLEGGNCAKCAKELRTCGSPKDGEITHRQRKDRGQKIERCGSRNFGRFSGSKKRIFTKSRREISNPGHWIWKGTWKGIGTSLIRNQKKHS